MEVSGPHSSTPSYRTARTLRNQLGKQAPNKQILSLQKSMAGCRYPTSPCNKTCGLPQGKSWGCDCFAWEMGTLSIGQASGVFSLLYWGMRTLTSRPAVGSPLVLFQVQLMVWESHDLGLLFFWMTRRSECGGLRWIMNWEDKSLARFLQIHSLHYLQQNFIESHPTLANPHCVLHLWRWGKAVGGDRFVVAIS